MDDREIAFVICVNNNVLLKGCKYYIEHLHVPDGFLIDIIAIYEAESMRVAYNRGMQSSKVKYKIYMHQDVFIRNVDFLKSMICEDYEERYRDLPKFYHIKVFSPCFCRKA